jgi:NAD(P)-dependent dehydrogenase (short-subunit alcohol dehydrogenase family)
MDLGLKDKVALVTGAGSPIGFGKAISLNLAQEGCNIIVNDINLEEARQTADGIEKTGRKAIAVKADISNGAEVDEMVRLALKEFGRIDILVNNAGIGISGIPFIEMTLQEWDSLININFKGVLFCTKAVLPDMIKRGSGKIINISSDAGRVGVPTASIYAATKAAVISFTKSLGVEVAPLGINVNGILPGSARTNLGRNATPEFLKLLLAVMPPKGRLTEPQDIARMVAFFASDMADDIVGQNISVDGGFVMY